MLLRVGSGDGEMRGLDGGEERISISGSEEEGSPLVCGREVVVDFVVVVLVLDLDLATSCDANGSSLSSSASSSAFSSSSSNCGVGVLEMRGFLAAGTLVLVVEVDLEVEPLGRPRGLDAGLEEGRGGLKGLGGIFWWFGISDISCGLKLCVLIDCMYAVLM